LFAGDQLDDLSMFDDTRLLARALFPLIGSIATAAEGGGALDLLRVLVEM
jgi:hypothetical protein